MATGCCLEPRRGGSRIRWHPDLQCTYGCLCAERHVGGGIQFTGHFAKKQGRAANFAMTFKDANLLKSQRCKDVVCDDGVFTCASLKVEAQHADLQCGDQYLQLRSPMAEIH